MIVDTRTQTYLMTLRLWEQGGCPGLVELEVAVPRLAPTVR
jgi:hypothetical protein